MAVPWLRLIDGVLGATDVVRWARGRSAAVERTNDLPRGLEGKLTGVVVAALKEAFERDYQRLDLERQRMEEERLRAERAMRLELLRQAGEREIGRLRLLAGVAAAIFLGSMFLITRLVGNAPMARVSMGVGWALLVAAIAASFAAQSRVATVLGFADDRSTITEVTGTSSGAAALWLIVLGLGSVALGVLFV
jgi:hypothetical protein